MGTNDRPCSQPQTLSHEELVERLERSRHQIAAVQVLTSALAGAMTIEEVVQAVMEHTSMLPAAAGVLGVCEGGELELLGHFGYSPAQMAPWQRLSLELSTPLTEAVRTGRVVGLSSRAEMAVRYPVACESVLGEGAWMALPLRGDSRVLGVLGLRLREERALQVREVDYLMMLGQQIGLALARARLYEQAREQAVFEQRLLAIISHDLRTPLTAIMMASSVLPREGESAFMVDRIERSARRMGDLIQSVLDMSSRRTAPVSVARVPTEVSALLADVCEELRVAFPERALELQTEGQGVALIDGVKVGQILANLVRNALQHGSPEGVVRVRSVLGASGLTLSVHNEGAPIPEEEQERLFQAFERGTLARSAGVGLGLHIVREMARAMGGDVSVRSDEQETAFTVWLPVS